MKTILLTMALCLCCIGAAMAQTEKGRWQIGVSVGSITYFKQGGSESFSGNLSPSAGYFVADNLLLGTGVPLSISSSKARGSLIYKSVTTGIGLSPFLRYYIGKSRLKPYVGASYSYTYNSYKYNTSLGSASGPGYSSIITPSIGLAYFINRNIALNAGLNYTIQKTEAKYIDLSSISQGRTALFTSKGDSRLFSLGIGFQLFLGK